MAQELTLASAVHLAAVVPAVVIGAAQLLRPKGTRPHKVWGWVWVLVAMALAIWHIRRGNVRAHKGFMVGTLLGLVAAGVGALMPGRFLAQLFL